MYIYIYICIELKFVNSRTPLCWIKRKINIPHPRTVTPPITGVMGVGKGTLSKQARQHEVNTNGSSIRKGG